MTREEAIEKLELMRQKVDEETYRALILAIKALSQEPTFDDECQKDMDEAWEQIQKKRKRIPVTLDLTPCDDAISREAAINIASLHCLTIDESVKAIKNLPPVTQKSGKWHRKYDRIVNDLFWECDKCGCGYQHEYNYCPNCGAKMESEDDVYENFD